MSQYSGVSKICSNKPLWLTHSEEQGLNLTFGCVALIWHNEKCKLIPGLSFSGDLGSQCYGIQTQEGR